MKVINIGSDVTGCLFYRAKLPLTELKRFGVDTDYVFSTPASPDKPMFNRLYDMIAQYDLVHVQRCPVLEVVHAIRDICHILNKPLVFDTDDDYLNVPEHNPAHHAFSGTEFVEKYKEVLRMMDMVTVSTQELKDLYYPYNKNIHVLPNNVEYIIKDRDVHELKIVNGKHNIGSVHGVMVVPGYIKKEKEIDYITRVGYTVTQHHIKDFETVRLELEKIINKYKNKILMVIIGEKYFYEKLLESCKQLVYIPITNHHDQYLHHVRNIDIGIAPLERTLFNMSKSSIKAVEYGQWGIPAVLPNYVTYTREFTHNKTSLMYNNAKEFSDQLCELIENRTLRSTLGSGSKKFVEENKLERQHSNKRFELYQTLFENRRQPMRFEGKKDDRGYSKL